MNRLWLVGVIAIIAASSAGAEPSSQGLQKAANCMLKVLKSLPGVSDPKIGTGNNESLCLKYRPDEKSVWKGPTAFCADTKHLRQPYRFVGNFPGLLTPGEKPDIHVSESVMKEWRAQCAVDAEGVFN